MTGLWVALGAVAIACAFGFYRRTTDGQFKSGKAASEETVAIPAMWHGRELGERATLVQFSSAFCAPCRTTRYILADVTETTPGVVHHDVDAELELELVRELGITRTPTTLILNAAGDEVARAAGAPRKEQVLAALSGLG